VPVLCGWCELLLTSRSHKKSQGQPYILEISPCHEYTWPLILDSFLKCYSWQSLTRLQTPLPGVANGLQSVQSKFQYHEISRSNRKSFTILYPPLWLSRLSRLSPSHRGRYEAQRQEFGSRELQWCFHLDPKTAKVLGVLGWFWWKSKWKWQRYR